MTGAYLRVKRDGKWQAVEVEYLTKEERWELLSKRTPGELCRWLDIVCEELASITPIEATP